jgi:hypothetical protein
MKKKEYKKPEIRMIEMRQQQVLQAASQTNPYEWPYSGA